MAKRCQKKMRKEHKEKEVVKLGKRKIGFFQDRGIELGKMEKERGEGMFEFCKRKEKDSVRQKEK